MKFKQNMNNWTNTKGFDKIQTYVSLRAGKEVKYEKSCDYNYNGKWRYNQSRALSRDRT
ncbi:hypothetical protein LXJ15735_34520 [Lacrimispora xylanolytica]